MATARKTRTTTNTPTAPAHSPPELIDQLARTLRRHGLTELEFEDRNIRVVLRRGPAVHPSPAVAATITAEAFPMTPGLKPAPSGSRAIAPARVVADGADTDPSEAFITAPLVGTFYRAPSPTAAVFAEVGTTLRKGAVACIVEAMKLMNQIEAEFACTVVEVLVQNGDPVEFGQRLFRVRRQG